MPVTLWSSLSNDDHYLENSISNHHHHLLSWSSTLYHSTSLQKVSFKDRLSPTVYNAQPRFTLKNKRFSVFVHRFFLGFFFGESDASQHDEDHHNNDDVIHRFIIEHIIISVGILHGWGYVHGTCSGRNHLPSRDVRSRKFRPNTMFRIHAQSHISILTGIQ